MKTQSTAGGGGGCLPYRLGPFLVSSLVSLLGPSCLLASYGLVVSSFHPLIRSSHPLAPLCPSCLLPARPLAPPHRLIGSPPASYRLAPRIIDKGGGEIAGSSSAGGRLLACVAVGGGRGIIAVVVVCLLGHGGRLMLSSCVVGRRGLFACLRGGGRRAARSFLVPLIGSSNRQGIGYGSAHPIGSSPHRRRCAVGFLFFSSFRLTPSRRLLSACLLWLVPPSPAGGCDGYGMVCGGGRADCLLAFPSPVSLSHSRSFACCYVVSVSSLGVVVSGALWGVLRAILPACLSALAFFNTCP